MKNDVLIDSSGYILQLLEKLLDADIEIQGLENIPYDNPKIFVANHFTRLEAMVVPYALYHKTNKKVGVIADDALFESKFGDYLKKIGALSKKDPDRNKIIISDILKGEKDWMIFPEGRMVKGKKIIKQDDFYSVKIDGKTEKIYTGAAFFAIKSQLLREDFISQKIDKKDEFIEKYFKEASFMDVSEKDTYVVPINITYSPLRNGDNVITDIGKKLFENISDKLKEELEIEGNIVLKSKIIIQILKPINIRESLGNIHRVDLNSPTHTHKNHEYIIDKLRYPLTKQFMKTIYEGLTISFDHIFVLTLFILRGKEINKEHLKRLIYLMIKEIKKSSLFTDSSINKNLLNLISYEKHEAFEEILLIAKSNNIVVENKESYIIDENRLLEGFTHHTIRLKNILKVILNEILIIDSVVNLVDEYCKLSLIAVNFMLTRELEEEEKNEYKEEYERYECDKDRKNKNIGESFLLRNENSKDCIIAIHGFSSAPKEVWKMSKYLNKKGFNVYAPRLRGHGTSSLDLSTRSYEDWYNSLSRAIVIASLKYKNINIIGFSTGGLLALLSTKKKYSQIKSIVCINAAIDLKDIRINTLVPAVNFWNDVLTKLNFKNYRLDYVDNIPENPHINYNKHYVKSIKELSKLMEKTKEYLENIRHDILIIQSSNDPVVEPKSGFTIYEKIKSNIKEIYLVARDNHVIINSKGKKKIFKRILEFLNK